MTREEILKMEPGPEFDALMAEHVMGWKRRTLLSDNPEYFYHANGSDVIRCRKRWSPSRDIEAAWPLAVKVGIIVWPTDKGRWLADAFKMHDDNTEFCDGSYDFPFGSHVVCKKAPEAICKAALIEVMEL